MYILIFLGQTHLFILKYPCSYVVVCVLAIHRTCEHDLSIAALFLTENLQLATVCAASSALAFCRARCVAMMNSNLSSSAADRIQ